MIVYQNEYTVWILKWQGEGKHFVDFTHCFYVDELSYLEILTVQEPWLAVKRNLP